MRYESYKPSGVAWLGEIPEHWEMKRVKALFSERIEKGHPKEPFLAATQSKGVVTKSEYGQRTVVAQKDLHLLKLVKKGDFVISLRSFEGGIEYSYAQGIISPAYTILKLTKQANDGFFKYFLKSSPFVNSLTLYVTGIREGQNIEYSRLNKSYFPFPSIEEQESIVRYLSFYEHKINKAIHVKKKLIATLSEQKQAIIAHAVTKGVDLHVKMKESGIPWLGEIPEHWEIEQGLAAFQEKKVKNTGLKEKRVLSLSYGKIIIKPEEKLKGLVPESFETYQIVDGGDIIIRSTDLQNDITSLRIGLVKDRGIITSAYICLQTTDLISSQFGYLLLHVLDLLKVFYGMGSGLRQNLSYKDLKRMPIWIPPLEEQKAIVEFIEKETVTIDKAIELSKKEIELLEEYKTRLIADMVTGAVDVREEAQNLPQIEEVSVAFEGEAYEAEEEEMSDE